MWRFLLAGLVTVCGLLLLFMASLSDPGGALRDARRWFPVMETPKPVASNPAQPTPDPSPALAAQQHQRDELQQQVQLLRSRLAQTTQDMTSLRSEAEAEKQNVERLRAKNVSDQAELDRLKSAPPPAPPQNTKPSLIAQTKPPAPAPQPAPSAQPQSKLAQTTEDTAPLRTEAEAEKHDVEGLRENNVSDQAEAGRLKSPPAAPQNTKPSAIAQTRPPTASPSAQPAPLAKLADNTSPPSKPAPTWSKPAPPDAMETVLNRLRHEPPPPSPPMQASDSVAQNQPPPAPDAVAQNQPPPASAQARLSSARAALVAGRIDEAQSLLEQAQVQLVFRPVGPSGDAAPTGSVAAGQIAEALSMLGAGDIPDAMRYIDMAMRQTGNVLSNIRRPLVAAERSPYDDSLSRQ